MKEGIQINKVILTAPSTREPTAHMSPLMGWGCKCQGLLALGNVINALADEEALKRKEKVKKPSALATASSQRRS